MRKSGLQLVGCALIAGCAQATVRPTVVPPLNASTLLSEPFDRIDPERWQEVSLKGHSRFTITVLDGQRALQASSHAAASMLVHRLRADPHVYPHVSWRWRAERLLSTENLARKDGSDAVARVYVYFDTPGLPWQRRNIDYVWSSSLPVGTTLPSAFASTSMIIVAESGPEHLGAWRTVTRNVRDDYRRCFGQEPPDVLAIGLMTDTDSTGAEATAYYDDVLMTREPPAVHPPPASP